MTDITEEVVRAYVRALPAYVRTHTIAQSAAFAATLARHLDRFDLDGAASECEFIADLTDPYCRADARLKYGTVRKAAEVYATAAIDYL